MSYDNTMLADVLDKAVEVLEGHEWGQGCGRIGERQICGQDAIWGAAMKHFGVAEWTVGVSRPGLDQAPSPDQLRVEALYVYLNNLCTPDKYKIFGAAFWRWNDEAGRTKEEVIDRLKEVAKDLRNGATP